MGNTFLFFISLPNYSFIGKTEVVAIAYNDVIQNLDAHELSGGSQFPRKYFIFRAGRNVRAGVIVNADNRRREFLQGRVDNFPHNRQGMIDRSRYGVADFDDSIVAVEIGNFKDFCFEVAHLRHDDADNVPGGHDLLLDAQDFVFTEAVRLITPAA